MRHLLLLAVFILPSVGCVRRRLTFRTNPAGASIYVDKQYIGTSPISASPIYYGTREIEAVADGFRTEKVMRTFSPPWYQIPPLDFISETLWPWEIRDERIVDITLVPYQAPNSEVLQARADSLRIQASQGFATPIPPTTDLGFQPSILPPQATAPGIGAGPIAPSWRPGQILGNFFRPGGGPPERIPEAGILSGGGYRPPVPDL